jgi:cyclic pyranopterin phosphate synthase
MPREHFDQEHHYLPRADILSFEEIARVVCSLLPLGLRKVRLTGGEPLLRSELHKLVAVLREEQPKLEVALTTNGSLLAKQAQALRDAGLNRLTVSLDSLAPEVFARMTDSELPVTDILAGIEAAHAAGFGPIKINAVVRRGVNDHTIVELARHFKGSGDIVRFIEYMDVGLTNGWRMDHVLSGAEIVARIGAELPLEAVSANYAGEVAKRYRYLDGSGEIGVISSVTQPFCGDCGRLRLSADGHIFGCLFARAGTDLRALLRASPDDSALTEALRSFWRVRGDRYSELRSIGTGGLPRPEMSYLGG